MKNTKQLVYGMKKIDIVGFGPGKKEKMTLEAVEAIEKADVIVGFSTYVEILKESFPNKEYVSTGMGSEIERCKKAFELAKDKDVALVCSGDSSVYGLAGLMYELSEKYKEIRINTIPGVTAAISGGALLGAAMGHDFACVSLSDYLTSSEDIKKRLLGLASCDMVMALYNPRSKARPDSLKEACELLLSVLPEDRPCGITANIGRENEFCQVMTLLELRDYEADMFTIVFIGNSKTKIIDDRLVTPRGYKL